MVYAQRALQGNTLWVIYEYNTKNKIDPKCIIVTYTHVYSCHVSSYVANNFKLYNGELKCKLPPRSRYVFK